MKVGTWREKVQVVEMPTIAVVGRKLKKLRHYFMIGGLSLDLDAADIACGQGGAQFATEKFLRRRPHLVLLMRDSSLHNPSEPDPQRAALKPQF